MRCACGAIGCWETEAGEGALLRQAGLAIGTGGRASVDLVIARAAAGEQQERAAIESVGRWLGLGIADLINLFNPELVVLGGMYARLHPLMHGQMEEGVRSRALAAPGSMVRIVPTALGIDAPLIGAAELALSAIIDDPIQIAATSNGG